MSKVAKVWHIPPGTPVSIYILIHTHTYVYIAKKKYVMRKNGSEVAASDTETKTTLPECQL
jgi:hypothetical protein